MARPGKVELSPGLSREAGLRRLIEARLNDVLRHTEPLGALAAPGPPPQPPMDFCAEGALEQVHDARVATRRLRATLQVYPLRPRALWKAAQAEVQGLGRALGALRDLDLVLLFIEGIIEEADPEERAGILALGFRLGARQAEARRALA